MALRTRADASSTVAQRSRRAAGAASLEVVAVFMPARSSVVLDRAPTPARAESTHAPGLPTCHNGQGTKRFADRLRVGK